MLQTTGVQGLIKCKVEHYFTEDGLSHNSITSIIKSSDGYMWFGTWDGISCYGGHNFQRLNWYPANRLNEIEW